MPSEEDIPHKLIKTFQDEMFTDRRYETSFPEEMFPDPVIPMKTCWRWRMRGIEQDFSDSGWPSFKGRVFIDGDDNWSPVTPELEEHLLAEGVDPRAETFPPSPIRIERGLDYIHRRIAPLTAEHWLVQEVKIIQGILAARTKDAALLGAVALGELTARAAHHHMHLPTLRTGARVLHGASRGAWPRSEENKKKRQPVLKAMEALLQKQPRKGASWAARTAYERGLGTSAEANRTLWKRHCSK